MIRSRALLLIGAVTALALVALSAAINGRSFSGAALRALGCVALLAGLAFALHRGRLSSPCGRLTILERQALTRESGLALIQIDDRHLLVGYGAAGARRLLSLGTAREDRQK